MTARMVSTSNLRLWVRIVNGAKRVEAPRGFKRLGILVNGTSSICLYVAPIFISKLEYASQSFSPALLFLFIMGLSPYTTPADAGVFCVILVHTAISISIVKGMVRSILHVIGINFASWEEYSIEGPLDSFECRGSPSGSYMEEFRRRTPAVRYDSLCISNHPAQECPVCLADFNHDAEINCLSCDHVFHKLCLEKWLKNWNVTCPLCRNYIMPQEGEEDTCPM